jgi:hypothetical protein
MPDLTPWIPATSSLISIVSECSGSRSLPAMAPCWRVKLPEWYQPVQILHLRVIPGHSPH